MMGIHLRLFHNSDKLFGVYNGLFDSPVMYPNWGRVSHLLVKLLVSCYLGYMVDQQGGLSFCDILLCWDLSILNVSFWFKILFHLKCSV